MKMDRYFGSLDNSIETLFLACSSRIGNGPHFETNILDHEIVETLLKHTGILFFSDFLYHLLLLPLRIKKCGIHCFRGYILRHMVL